MGSLIVRVVRGVNLACRDVRGSDPYIVLLLGNQGHGHFYEGAVGCNTNKRCKKAKTKVKKNCLNPEWDEELKFTVKDPCRPMKLEVFDKDWFSKDDKMGEAEIDIQPLIDASKLDLIDQPYGVPIKIVLPTQANCLANESSIKLSGHMIVQDVIIRLRNVECGEVELQLQYASHAGSRRLLSSYSYAP